ncbi:hypothetical protein [Pseudoxanthomonas sp. UTMC 1351]|uniref:hypothetical protein n=1 Tax=Pseudoxanthomonas sp. UTMC 1351 TaxID=2695853 RepID=UPI0034CF70C8
MIDAVIEASPPMLIYGGYLLWLLAGAADFLCHRRTDLPHTSGLAESWMHLLQLAVIGSGLVLWLALTPSLLLLSIELLLVTVHAVFGYVDTRRAFGRRVISPVEQHVHSILDMAPIIAFGILLGSEWSTAWQRGWTLAARQPPFSPAVWMWVLAPALLLCVLPALLEFRAAWSARGRRLRHAW